MLPLPTIPSRTPVHCRGIRTSGRRCNLLLLVEPWRSMGMGRDCAVRHGLIPPRTGSGVASPDDPTLFDIHEGEPVIETFRRKPIAVETMLWDGTNSRAVEIKAWVGVTPGFEPGFLLPAEVAGVVEHAQLWIAHNSDWGALPVGHRVVKESSGDGFYPISPEAVAATFEPVGA